MYESLYGEWEETEENDRDILITQAQLKIEAVMSNSRKNFKGDELEKAVALVDKENFNNRGRRGAGNQSEGAEGTGAPPEPANIENPGDKSAGKKGGVMKPEELLAQDPDCYKAVISLGEAAALEKERKRINAHLKMGKESGDLELAAKFIQEGKSVQDDEVHADYLAAAMKKKNLQGRLEDNPPPAGTEGSDDADEAELMKSFDLGYKKKDGGKE
ncbi:hypothetical protein FACS1894161_2350 [Spirochaetia bacterium]|nr:hypothetical protein FACS1894161_2350 [Spirochaetia bacterium]